MANAPELGKTARREAAREAARRMREQEKKRARRSRIFAIVGACVATLAVVGTIGTVLIQSHRNSAQYAQVAYGGSDSAVVAPEASSVTAPVANATDGIIVNNKGLGSDNPSDVHVAIYFDFQCPYCRKFEEANGAALSALIQQGGVTLVYHPLAFLDRFSANTLYSTRSANAAAVVAHTAGDKFLPFIAALYAHQPAENTPGRTDSQISDAAREAGVPDSVAATFTDTIGGTYTDSKGNQHDGTWRQYAPWVFQQTAKAESDFGANFGTPTVLINGQRFTGDLYTNGPLEDAIRAAQS